MPERLHVRKDGEIIYDITLESGFDNIAKELKALSYDSSVKIMIVTDTNVAPLYLEELKNALFDEYKNIYSCVIDAGEENKTIETVQNVYEDLILNKFERRDLLIALGGGVVGDLTGFTAATYLRGVDFIQIPTTLISMSDSSIGGKTGVDFKAYKNMVGAFYMPKLVYMNLSALNSLPDRQLASGMGEVIKHGYIKNRDLLDKLNNSVEKIHNKEFSFMKEIIYMNCDIKRGVVENDPTEKGERALLNFGHSIGHAIEKLMNFELYHGECVALGMQAASYISYKRGNITEDEYTSVIDICKKYDLPTKFTPKGFNAINIIETMKSDKKMDKGTLKFILLEKVGSAIIDRTVTDEEITEAVKTII
ncbi:MAG: 3-dehydroquinate synthase [Eubacterium sp.]|nr:3-dehydroquinate synthase [Eubacterium sp.]